MASSPSSATSRDALPCFTAAELAGHIGGSDGGDAEKRILISVFGDIFDVTSGRDFYGAGKGYSVFAGKEVTRCLGKMIIGDAEANCGWANLTLEHVNIAKDWHAKYVTKYPIVGRFQPDEHFEIRGAAFEP